MYFSFISFHQSPDLKKRIESLIEREYMERDKDNPNLYHYVAWTGNTPDSGYWDDSGLNKSIGYFDYYGCVSQAEGISVAGQHKALVPRKIWRSEREEKSILNANMQNPSEVEFFLLLCKGCKNQIFKIKKSKENLFVSCWERVL